MRSPFDLQGHRGARGLKPENTLPSFEAAFDSGVTSVETDVHLTRDGAPVLVHDAFITARTCRVRPGSAVVEPTHQPPVHSLTLAELRHCCADCNPDPGRFPQQTSDVTPAARLFAEQHGSIRTLRPRSPICSRLRRRMRATWGPGRAKCRSSEREPKGSASIWS